MMRSVRFGRALLAVIFAAGTAVAAPAPAATGPAGDLDKYLPDGTQFVVSFNVKQLLDAPLVKTDKKAFDEGMEHATKGLQDFGVDPKKDIDRVIIAASEDVQKALIFLEGRFDAAKIEGKLEAVAKENKDKLKVITEGKAKIFQTELPAVQVPFPGFPSTLYATVLSDKLIAVAVEKDALSDAIAKKTGSKKAEVKKDVLDLIGKISPTETLSVVVIPPAAAAQGGGPAADVTQVTGGITVAEGVKTHLQMATKNADAAKTLADQINQGLQQAAAFLPALAGQGVDQKQIDVMKEVVGTMKATAEGSGVSVKSTISKEFIQKHSGKKDT
jgi:hypothetical protein